MKNFSKGGYMGKILRINLTQSTFLEEKIETQVLRNFIGGVGLAIKILYDEVPPKIKPFDPENRLIFLTGPLTGTIIPGSGIFEVMAKSPLTGFVGSGQANGYFGVRLKRAGYDGIIIEGKSPKWVYLHIHDGEVELKDASFLLGKTTYEVEDYFSKIYREKKKIVSVASIGPAGENRVRFAIIMSDFGHIVASGGLGAVMGSKNLKAIVVGGNSKIPIDEKTKDKVKQLAQEWREKAYSTGSGVIYSKWGTQGVFPIYWELGWVPVKNLTTNIFSAKEKFDPIYLREKVFKRIKKTPCHACTYDHCSAIKIDFEPYSGIIMDNPEYEDLAGWGPNVGITDPRESAMLTYINDSLGMDLKECTFTISLAMECYEKGLITRKETGGIDLSWGNTEAIIQLIKKIAMRQEFGDFLADGVKKTADHIGQDAHQFAVYVKRGFAPHVHDPRARWGTLFSEAISDTGSIDGIDLTTRSFEDLGIKEPTKDPDEKVAFAQARTGPFRHLEDSIMNCFFYNRGNGILRIMTNALNVVTGFNYSIEEFLEVGERITNLLRAFNIREGLTPKDDSLSPRLLTPPQEGPQKGRSFATTFPNVLIAYYREKGWDEKTGKPLPQTLKRLKLEKTIKDIW